MDCQNAVLNLINRICTSEDKKEGANCQLFLEQELVSTGRGNLLWLMDDVLSTNQCNNKAFNQV